MASIQTDRQMHECPHSAHCRAWEQPHPHGDGSTQHPAQGSIILHCQAPGSLNNMASSISCARVLKERQAHVKRTRSQLGKGPLAWSSTIKIRTH